MSSPPCLHILQWRVSINSLYIQSARLIPLNASDVLLFDVLLVLLLSFRSFQTLLLVRSLIYRQDLLKIDLFLVCFLFDFSHCSRSLYSRSSGRAKDGEKESLVEIFSRIFFGENSSWRLSRKSTQRFKPNTFNARNVPTYRLRSTIPNPPAPLVPCNKRLAAIAACQLRVYLIFAF